MNSVRLRARATEVLRSADDVGAALLGHAWLASPGTGIAFRDATRDGNRSAVLDQTIEARGRTWHLAVKGVGAASPMYGDSPLEHGFVATAEGHRDLTYAITREGWMGEAPYGAQGLENALDGFALSERARSGCFAPAVLCPIVAVVRIPEDEIVSFVHYRPIERVAVQEHRLVPSRVRLFHQADLALSRDPGGVLEHLGIGTVAALDVFLDAFLRTGLALMTVGARDLEVVDDGFAFLDYDDAWLDKDTFVAPDGALAFADLEALAPVLCPDVRALELRIRRQVDRNAYEWLYAVDALLAVRERWCGCPLSVDLRRATLADRIEIALAGDPCARAERDARGGLDLIVQPRSSRSRRRLDPVRIAFLAGLR